MKLETKDLVKLVLPLIAYPWLASFIEADYIDHMEAIGYWDTERCTVTGLGRDFVAANEFMLKK